jgi:hypothetical protein
MVTARTAEQRRRLRHHGPAPSQPAHRGRAVPSRERLDRGRPPDDPQLPGDVNEMERAMRRMSPISRATLQDSLWLVQVLAAASVLCASEPATTPVSTPQAVAPEAGPSPLSPSTAKNPDAAAKVTGALEVTAGKAIIAASGTVTSGNQHDRGCAAASRRAARLRLHHRPAGRRLKRSGRRDTRPESSPKCSVDSHSSGLLVLVLVG